MIGWLAQYLLYAMVIAFAAIWLFAEDRAGRVQLAGSALIGLLLVWVLITVAAAVHDDPRPFVQNPALQPLIAHAADNGFPSDHSAAAGLIAVLIWLRHRWYGTLLGVVALVLGAARVAAHVHHVQDIVAGLLIGGVAAWLGSLAAAALIGRLARSRADGTRGRLATLLHGSRLNGGRPTAQPR
ncbi:phosphatase PAP2 family protein [Nakamurella lactea]|uniref:phosphatase PAP2 family protein n=1 Tax=Nakamurella lactea TaxID=459515 RepID=UPI0004223FDF|nr:phosphatase PAP2 family protein [Nakamurella lactea]